MRMVLGAYLGPGEGGDREDVDLVERRYEVSSAVHVTLDVSGLAILVSPKSSSLLHLHVMAGIIRR